MLAEQNDVFYYLTVGNENYAQPSMPEGVRDGVLRGMYPLAAGAASVGKKEKVKGTKEERPVVQLLASGAILTQALAAADLLAEFGVDAQVWSVTSWTELQRDGIDCERRSRVDFAAPAPIPYATQQLAATRGPVIAASDYVRALPELIRAFVPRRYVTLGTDGFGRSDTRQGLRDFFEIDARAIAFAALKALVDENDLAPADLAAAARQLQWNARANAAPWTR
jgi:pyruvate dehydrogenase E1 component